MWIVVLAIVLLVPITWEKCANWIPPSSWAIFSDWFVSGGEKQFFYVNETPKKLHKPNGRKMKSSWSRGKLQKEKCKKVGSVGKVIHENTLISTHSSGRKYACWHNPPKSKNIWLCNILFFKRAPKLLFRPQVLAFLGFKGCLWRYLLFQGYDFKEA